MEGVIKVFVHTGGVKLVTLPEGETEMTIGELRDALRNEFGLEVPVDCTIIVNQEVATPETQVPGGATAVVTGKVQGG